MTVRTAILILVVSTASVAHAGIRDIRISWSQPDTATTMTVSWNSDSVDDPSRVQYGYVAPGQFEAEGEVIYVGGDLDAVHVVELTELKPDTVYQYRVGEEGNWSEIHDFRTGHEDL